MRLPILLLVLILCSCGVRKSGFTLGGGASNLVVYPNTAVDTPLFATTSTADFSACSSAYSDSPKLSKAWLRAKRKRQELGFFVDTVPPPALRNKADLELARAQEWLDRYERNQANRAVNMAAYLIISVPALIAVFVLLESEMVGTSQYVLYQLMLVLLGIGAIWGWLIGGWIIADLPKWKAASAYQKIRNAPRKAPPERRIEYEVRVLLMLNEVMSPKEQIKRIRKIRDMAQTDPHNPWLEKLKKLKFYNLSVLTP